MPLGSPCRRRRRRLLLLLLLPLLLRQARAQAGEDGPGRPYAVLRTQNLALMGSILGLLLIIMVLMAVCVYKPLRRR